MAELCCCCCCLVLPCMVRKQHLLPGYIYNFTIGPRLYTDQQVTGLRTVSSMVYLFERLHFYVVRGPLKCYVMPWGWGWGVSFPGKSVSKV